MSSWSANCAVLQGVEKLWARLVIALKSKHKYSLGILVSFGLHEMLFVYLKHESWLAGIWTCCPEGTIAA